MKYTIGIVLFLLCTISFVSAHEPPVGYPVNSDEVATTTTAQRANTGVDLTFHLVIFGGLGVAGVIGLRENKKTTGKYLAWYRG